MFILIDYFRELIFQNKKYIIEDSWRSRVVQSDKELRKPEK